jgi:lysophospholipase
LIQTEAQQPLAKLPARNEFEAKVTEHTLLNTSSEPTEAQAKFVGKLGGEDIILPTNSMRSYPVRGHLWQPSKDVKGWFLILPGFTEFCEKYALTARRLVKAGYGCLLIDWPGQGRSGHLGMQEEIVHCDDFNQHLSALHDLLDATNFLNKKFFVLGHSMGGYFGLQTAKNYPQHVNGLIVISPMIVPLAPPLWLTRALAGFLISIGYGRKLVPFSTILPVADARRFRLDNVLTRYPEGYDRQYQIFEKQPELRRFRPSVGWIQAAFTRCAETSLNPEWMASIRSPVLSLLAGDERVVNLAKSKEMLAHLPNHHQVIFTDARHELLNELPETVRKLFDKIFHFIAQADS